ncbi:uncharacterized protein F5891DRAFT_1198882 [Suillus fuscotomentosus]|uniref:Uncharacterized protein n=1 Tax=Suillus fuscotomentosus TaxID=1912939 RepID=A0AAD4HCQ4_9AGAM|nr:uncharacterized protein F5891DRAFT_1198882 [Suillus fuscotomentosus]KAG1889004.1 hypothetical protein F5891DRAFT_1198882 [Suillus fuscotomentosus]
MFQPPIAVLNKGNAAARREASVPVDLNAPDIIYTAEDDQAINQFYRDINMSISPLKVGTKTYSTALLIGERAAMVIAEDLGINCI